MHLPKEVTAISSEGPSYTFNEAGGQISQTCMTGDEPPKAASGGTASTMYKTITVILYFWTLKLKHIKFRPLNRPFLYIIYR